ncbi:MAG: DUF4065 domain-containing protein [Oscillospiraceae bacterium]|nr:DUF4065 domain-containing protein [Oscillospiraceae bacterium]
MSVYESIMNGLGEALEYAKGDTSKARETTVTVTQTQNPVTFGLSALDVAKWLIVYNNSQESADLLTDLKLQKLLYYAQGIAIKYTGKPLFNENLVAWDWGPVVPEVYNKYKKYGKNPIDEPIEKPNFDNNDIEVILKDVYEDYGQFSAFKLVKMTHDETPWKETPKNDVISIDKMRDFFAR